MVKYNIKLSFKSKYYKIIIIIKETTFDNQYFFLFIITIYIKEYDSGIQDLQSMNTYLLKISFS